MEDRTWTKRNFEGVLSLLYLLLYIYVCNNFSLYKYLSLTIYFLNIGLYIYIQQFCILCLHVHLYLISDTELLNDE